MTDIPDRLLDCQLIDRKTLSELTGLGIQTIKQLDYSGAGPTPIRIGRRGLVRYRLKDVEAWIARCGAGRRTS